jgi:glucosamine--fructose-6-phosphate aminotransferase (isomerizing)
MTLLSEIHEQADVLENLLSSQARQIEGFGRAILKKAPQFVFLAARGTSDNAGRYANYVWGSMNRLPSPWRRPLFSLYQNHLA